MGIDLPKGGRVPKRNFRKTKTTNMQLRGLIKLFTFLNRRAPCAFNKVILKRLNQSRTTRSPISLSRIVKILGSKAERTAVIVGTVTNDNRILDIPKINVCALHFS